MFALPFARFQLELLVVEPIELNRFVGTTLRGSFGITLKENVCIFKHYKSCTDCLARYVCAYSFLFETPIQPSQRQLFTHGEIAPHPYILELPSNPTPLYKEGDKINFTIILLGKAIDYLPYVIHVFEKLSEKGLGKGRGKFILAKVALSQNNPLSLYRHDTQQLLLEFPIDYVRLEPPATSCHELTIDFLTPTSIKQDGKLVRQLRFETLFYAILRRLKVLNALYGSGEPLEVPPEIIDNAQRITLINRKTHWDTYERFSGRQKKLLEVGGIVGQLTFQGELTPFIPYFRAGEILHIGKNTSFGLGQYRIKIEG